MVVAAILSAIHVLTLAVGLGAVYLRGRALRQTLDDAGWRRLLAADNLWGLAAALWLASGVGRVFFGGKETSFYWRNGFFWLKLGLFGIVFVLELRPMMTFISVRSALRNGSPMPAFPLRDYQRINSAEIALVVAIVFAATFMARGAWMF